MTSPKFDAYHTWLGIPPEDQPPNHYRLLGIKPFEDDAAVIEHAADQRMAYLRTFQTSRHSEASQEMLNQVSAAKLCLLNPPAKARYDEQLRRLLPAAPRPASGPPPPRQPVDENLSAMFQQVQADEGGPGWGLPAARRRRGKLPLVLGCSGLGLLMLVMAIAFALSGGRRPPPAKTSLVFDWPAEERQGVILSVDGRELRFPTDGRPLTLRCRPGKHEIHATRLGYKPFARLVTLKAGECKRIEACWLRPTHLVLVWPAAEREAAKLEVDGTFQDLSELAVHSGPEELKVALDAGPHRVRACRPGFRLFEKTVKIVEGKDLRLRPVWTPLSSEPGPSSSKGPHSQDGTSEEDRSLADLLREVEGPGAEADLEAAGTEAAFPAAESLPAETRAPVPSAEQRAQLARQVEESHRLARAASAAEKLQQARKLFQLGQLATKGSPEQFVLFSKAMELARDGGDAELTFDAVDAIAVQFDVDPLQAKSKLLPRLLETATGTVRFRCLMQAALDLLDRAAAEHRGRLAMTIAELADRAAQGPQGEPFRARVAARHAEVRELYQRWQAFQQALATLRDQPQDAQANLVAGRWYCLREEDWRRGLPLLGRSSDARLRAAAAEEQTSPPGGPLEQVKLADTWWTLAEGEEGWAKEALQRHAATWYQRAQPKLTQAGVRTRVAERLSMVTGVRVPEGLDLARPALKKELPQDQWIDLLELVDVRRDGTRGGWKQTDGEIATAEPFSQLMFPVRLQGAYDVEVELTRESGDDALGVILPVATRACNVILSGWHGDASGLQMIGGRDARSNPTKRRPATLMNGRRYVLSVSVRPEGDAVHITALLDGDPLFEWEGKQTRLGLTRGWSLPKLHRLGLAAVDCPVTFHRVQLRIVSGRGGLLEGDEAFREPYMLTPDVGGESGVVFHDFAPRGACLAGFRFVISDRIEGIQAAYQTEQGLVDGPRYGKGGPPNHAVVAKDGYAIGGLVVPLEHTAGGMRILFMRVTRGGLNPDDHYQSPWIGRLARGPQITLAGKGDPVVGIHGACTARDLVSIGLILPRDPQVGRSRKTPDGKTEFVCLTELEPGWAKAALGGLMVNRALCDSWPMLPPDWQFCREFLFAHAPSKLIYPIPPGARSFSAVGYCVSSSSVQYLVAVDGTKLFQSESAGVVPIQVDLPKGGRQLELIVDDLGNRGGDRSYWLLPRFHRSVASAVEELDGKAKHTKLTSLRPLSSKVGRKRLEVNTTGENAWPVKLLEPRPCREFLFAPAPSRLRYSVPKGFREFSAVGYCVRSETVRFQVFADGEKLLWESKPAGIVRVRVRLPKGCSTLDLVVDPLGDGQGDHSCWCYPRFCR